MLYDIQLTMSDSQNLAVAASTVLSTNKIDRGVAGTSAPGFQARGSGPHNFGQEKNFELLVQVDETFTSAGAATLQVDLISDDDPLMGSPTVIQSTAALALATLIAGKQIPLSVPPGITERYVGVQYTIGTATMTAGKVTATFVCDRQSIY